MHMAVNSDIFEALLSLFYRISSVLVHFLYSDSSFLLKITISLVISEKIDLSINILFSENYRNGILKQ